METIDKVIGYLNQLQGLPAVALVALACIGIGYVVRFIPDSIVPNGGIPAIVILFGAIMMSLIADSRATDMSMRVWVVRNVAVGMTIGLGAWLSHVMLISRLEDWVQNWIAKRFPKNTTPE